MARLGLKARGQEWAFWALALVTSAVEPLTQLRDISVLSGAWLAVYGINMFGLNLAQAVCFRRYDFLAALVLRIGFYVTWQMLYVH